jgi:hypothetical protein
MSEGMHSNSHSSTEGLVADVKARLIALIELQRDGIISAEDYEREKAVILSHLSGCPPHSTSDYEQHQVGGRNGKYISLSPSPLIDEDEPFHHDDTSDEEEAGRSEEHAAADQDQSQDQGESAMPPSRIHDEIIAPRTEGQEGGSGGATSLANAKLIPPPSISKPKIITKPAIVAFTPSASINAHRFSATTSNFASTSGTSIQGASDSRPLMTPRTIDMEADMDQVAGHIIVLSALADMGPGPVQSRLLMTQMHMCQRGVERLKRHMSTFTAQDFADPKKRQLKDRVEKTIEDLGVAVERCQNNQAKNDREHPPIPPLPAMPVQLDVLTELEVESAEAEIEVSIKTVDGKHAFKLPKVRLSTLEQM